MERQNYERSRRVETSTLQQAEVLRATLVQLEITPIVRMRQFEYLESWINVQIVQQAQLLTTVSY